MQVLAESRNEAELTIAENGHVPKSFSTNLDCATVVNHPGINTIMFDKKEIVEQSEKSEKEEEEV